MTATQTYTVVRTISRNEYGVVEGEVHHTPGDRLPYAAVVSGDWVGEAASVDEAEALVLARLEDADTNYEPDPGRDVLLDSQAQDAAAIRDGVW